MRAAHYRAMLGQWQYFHPNGEPMSNQIATEPTSCLLKEGEAAKILNLEVATLRRWRWSGCGPRFLKLGGAVRYDMADLEAFIEAGRRNSTSDSGLAATQSFPSKD